MRLRVTDGARSASRPRKPIRALTLFAARTKRQGEKLLYKQYSCNGTKQGYGQTSGLQLASGAGWRTVLGAAGVALPHSSLGRPVGQDAARKSSSAPSRCPASQNAAEHAPSLDCGSPSHSEKALLQAVLPSRAAAPGALAATRSIRSAIGLFLRISYLP